VKLNDTASSWTHDYAEGGMSFLEKRPPRTRDDEQPEAAMSFRGWRTLPPSGGTGAPAVGPSP